jgi:hypothetical protein
VKRSSQEDVPRRVRQALEGQPHARELRAFIATPAGKAVAKELLEEFVLANPRGATELEIGMWLGAGVVARWFLRHGGADVAKLVTERTTE